MGSYSRREKKLDYNHLDGMLVRHSKFERRNWEKKRVGEDRAW